jgi:plastocyanin
MSKKILGAGVVLMLVAAVLVGVGASAVSAQSVSCANIDSMLTVFGITDAAKIAQAKVAFGCSGTASASYTFTRDLTVGSTGADVTALQTKLGVTPATGYFGSITKAAVVAYQTANGISATGYVGPLTRAALNYVAPVVVVPTVPGTPASSNLEGTDGTISDVSKLSTYNNEEVGEGQSNVKVLGMEVEASNDGDIQLKSIKLSLTQTNSGDSDKLRDYIDGVSVLLGSTEVGSADAADFTEDNTTDGLWTKTISLSNVVVKADESVKMYVTVDAINSFDSGDIADDDLTVAVENIRFVDGGGVTTTDDETGDLDPTTSAPNATIDFVSFSTAADTELKASLATDSPDSAVVEVDDTAGQTTDGVVLLKGKLKLDGSSDVLLDSMPVTFTSTGTGTDVDEVTGNVTLTIDGEEYSESVLSSATTTSTIVFDNLDLTISAGDTVNFTVTADVEDTEGALNNGDTLLASVTADDMDSMDVENEEGDQLETTELTGTAIGNALAFYDKGINITLSGTPTITKTSGTLASDSDIAVATIKIKVEAFGDTMYVAEVATAASGLPHVIASADTDVSIDVVDMDTSADLVGDGYEVAEGTPEYFTFTVTMSTDVTTSQTARASITSIAWDALSTTGADAYTYNFNMDDFKSPSTTILQH